MDITELGLSRGEWLVLNCGKYPSEKNCQLVVLAPAGQRGELLNTAVDHGMKCHAHDDADELRSAIGPLVETITVD